MKPSRHPPVLNSGFGPPSEALVTVTLVTIGFIIFFHSISEEPGAIVPPPTTRQIEGMIKLGRAYLEEGSFRLATRELGSALVLIKDHPECFANEQVQSLEQWHRQARLLARLVQKPLEEIVIEARGFPRDDEWQQLFREQYQGNAVLFDDEVSLSEKGEPRLQWYQLRVGNDVVRLELPLKVFKRLDLSQPRRVIFAAAIEKIERGVGGQWVIRFQPESGALITDPKALALITASALDAEARQVLRQQAEALGVEP